MAAHWRHLTVSTGAHVVWEFRFDTRYFHPQHLGRTDVLVALVMMLSALLQQPVIMNIDCIYSRRPVAKNLKPPHVAVQALSGFAVALQK